MSLWVCGATISVSRQNMTMCMWSCNYVYMTWLMSHMDESRPRVCLCVWYDAGHIWMSPDYLYVYVCVYMCDVTHVTNESVLIMCMSMCVTWLMSYMSQSQLCVYLCVWRDSCHPCVSHNYVYAYVCDMTHVTYEWITIICVYLCVWRDSRHIWMNHDVCDIIWLCVTSCKRIVSNMKYSVTSRQVTSHMHESCHMCMSQVTHAWVMSRMHESCQHKCVMSHMHESCVAQSCQRISRLLCVRRQIYYT